MGLRGTAAVVAYAIAALYAVVIGLTDYRLEARRKVRPSAHAMIEALAGAALFFGALYAPLLSAPPAQTLFAFVGLALLGVWAVTDPSGHRSEEKKSPRSQGSYDSTPEVPHGA